MRKTKRKQVGVRYLRLFQLEELNQITEDISGKNKEHTNENGPWKQNSGKQY